MRVLAAIQARLGSTRLLGKVLKPLLEKPMLLHIAERVQRCKFLTDVAIICPMKDFTEISKAVPGIQILSDGGISEDDLVRRYWYAAMSFGAGLVVRICADNPCVDPANIDLLMREYLTDPKRDEDEKSRTVLRSNAGDYPGSAWPKGLGAELYPYSLLRDMDKIVPDELREHPHITFHITHKIKEPKCPYDWGKLLPLAFDVNTPEEFQRAERIYNHFGHNKFTSKELIEYYV